MNTPPPMLSRATAGWEELQHAGSTHVRPARTILFHQGMPVRNVYLIERGLVKLERSEEEGRPVIVGLRRPGWLLGAAAVLLERPHATTATTLTTCHFHLVPAEAFQHLVETRPPVSWLIHHIHSREIYEHLVQVTELAGMTARRRLEQFLWDILASHRQSAPGSPRRLQLPIRQWELARYLGITPQYVTRLLGQLEDEGLLLRRKGWLIVADPHRLWHRPDS